MKSGLNGKSSSLYVYLYILFDFVLNFLKYFLSTIKQILTEKNID